METLANEINGAERELLALRKQEAALQNTRNPFGAVRRRALKKRVEESQAKLAALRAEWQDGVEPWLRARDTLAAKTRERDGGDRRSAPAAKTPRPER
jgi:hypothetical protein